MKTRTLLIALGVLAVTAVLCLGAAAGGALAFFTLRARPAQALGSTHLLQPLQEASEAGVLVAQVAEDSPAAVAGVVRGDIILEVNGEPVDGPARLSLALEDLKAGDRVELTVQHGDDQRTLAATLEERDGRPYLGVTPCGFSPRREVFFRAEQVGGALITEVTAGSPAATAGLEAGDRIQAVDEVEPGPEQGLAELIGAHQPGDAVTLQVSRPGEEPREVQVELGEHPEQPGKAYLGVKYLPAFRAALPEGLPFHELPFEGRPFEMPDLPEGVTQAVVIGGVASGGPAEAAGLQGMDLVTAVDGQPLESPEALAEAVGAHKPGDKITLTVFHPGDAGLKEVEVTLGEDPEEAGRAYLGVSRLGFIHIQREENRGPGSDLDLHFNFPLPDVLDRIRDRLAPAETL